MELDKKKVKSKIKDKGLKKSFVAKQIGVTNVMFSYYLNDKKELGFEKKMKLKNYLGL